MAERMYLGTARGKGPSGRWLLLVFAMGCGVGWLAAHAAGRAEADPERTYSALDELAQVIFYVHRDYIRPVPTREIVYRAISGLLSSLDRHSHFYPREQRERIRASMTNTFGGVGLQLREEAGRLRIVGVVSGSPAARAGLVPPLWLLEIDGRPCAGWSVEQARSALMGRVGTVVRLLVRKGVGQVRQVVLRRAVVRLPVVEASWAARGVGYLRIRKFAPGTAQAVQDALSAWRRQGLWGLILDLRHNPGGLVSEAVAVADMFMTSGIIVIRRMRRTGLVSMRARRRAVAPGLRLVLLVDGKTASAAELLAAALQENLGAVLVGEKTYGKGSIQEFVTLRQGSVLGLTVGAYYTPSFKQIEGRGLTPAMAPSALADPRPLVPNRPYRDDTWIRTALAVLAIGTNHANK